MIEPWELSYNGKKYLARDVYFQKDDEEYYIAEESLSNEIDDSTLEGVGLDNIIRAYVPRHVLYWDDGEIEKFVLKQEGESNVVDI